MPAPQGPCPERTEPNVLRNPRASVQRTALGLAYCILHEGPPGLPVPGPKDTVRVNYSGWNEEGKLFDSTSEHGGTPIEFPLTSVIRGWSEGLRLMTPGDQARLWIPGNLAYGRREPGEPAGDPPKGTLIFDVELIDVTVRVPADPPSNKEGERKPAQQQPNGRPQLHPRGLPQSTG
jgi:peptidylprolyl isomerase